MDIKTLATGRSGCCLSIVAHACELFRSAVLLEEVSEMTSSGTYHHCQDSDPSKPQPGTAFRFPLQAELHVYGE